MEVLSTNYLDTTTMLTIDSETLSVSNLFNKNKDIQYVSYGYADDTTATSITISFDETLSVDRICLLNHNIKSMLIYYNGSSTNTFAITGLTTASDITQNSSTSNYFKCTSVACTSVTFDLRTTISSNAEKAIGYLYLGEQNFEFDQIPSAKDYDITIDPKDVVHELSDGGTRINVVSTKTKVKIKLNYISASLKSNLEDLYYDYKPFVFVPFDTVTSWDEIFFESVWTGVFRFNEYSDNAAQAGWSGTLDIRETPY